MRGNQGGFGQRRSYAPVKVGDELDVSIEAVGEKGDGIAKKDGFVLFVPNTKQGDNVKVRVTRVLRKVGFAEVAGDSQGAVEQAPADDVQESDGLDEDSSSSDSEEFGEEEASENFGEEDQN